MVRRLFTVVALRKKMFAEHDGDGNRYNKGRNDNKPSLFHKNSFGCELLGELQHKNSCFFL